MAQFRTTADIADLALQKAGEVTNGNSPYEPQVLNYLNRVHNTLISGGTIPIGKDTTVQIDEIWPWSKAKAPLILELQPKYDTGTITLTQGGTSGTFSDAPTTSLVGYHFRVSGRSTMMKIVTHNALATSFQLDSAYPEESGSFVFTAMKIDYSLVPDYLVIDDSNNQFYFQKVLGTTLTAPLAKGTYTPAALATQVAAAATAAAGGPTITAAYDPITKKFAITSNLAGATAFYIVGHSATADMTRSAHRLLGYEDEVTSNAATHYSSYILGGISRLIAPFKVFRGSMDCGDLALVDDNKFQEDYPMMSICEGNPSRFCIIREDTDGTISVRINKYPREKCRVEIEYVKVPIDLKDNSSSIPMVPRKHIDVLEDAATFYIMLDKSDDRAPTYAMLLQGKLNAMISQNRGAQERAGKNFGQTIPRLDLTDKGRRRRLIYGDRD